MDKEPSRAKIIGVVGRQENESGVKNVAHMARAALVLRSRDEYSAKRNILTCTDVEESSGTTPLFDRLPAVRKHALKVHLDHLGRALKGSETTRFTTGQ